MNTRRILLAAVAAALLPGCGRYLMVQLPVHPTQRTWAADFDAVWDATLQVLGAFPLASVDRSSGYVITDRVPGRSENRYFGTPGKPYRMLETRYKMAVRVRPAPGGTEVAVSLHEETNYPRTVALGASSPRSSFAFDPIERRFRHRIGIEREVADLVEVDDWVPTPSTTLKERELLDRIEGVLGARRAGR